MILEKIKLHDFRNFSELSLEFGQKAIFLIGENGQGKTNLIESIYCLGLTRSFRTSAARDLIKIGAPSFNIHGEFRSEISVKHQVSILQQPKKKLSGSIRKRYSDILSL